MEIVAALGHADRFALVTYASDAETLVPLAPASASAKASWQRTVESIAAAGGTNMSAGLDTGLDMAMASRRGGRAARMILLSDGLANEGDASREGLEGRAQRAAHGELVLSAIGVGEDFDELLLGALADRGTGNFYYLSSAEVLSAVLAGELEAAQETVAASLEVVLEPRAGVEVMEAAGYPVARDGGRVSFRPGSLFAGQTRSLWITYAVDNRAPGVHSLGTVELAYRDAGGNRRALSWERPFEVACVADRDRFVASVDKGTWERGVIQERYGKLRQEVSRYLKEGRRDEALREIQAYKTENAALSRELASPAVVQNMADAEELERSVEDAFSGADQLEKQKLLGKQSQAAGWDSRRQGSKKNTP
jgi:Ca-activated chloride channel family protein